jgi:hypothetical protein
MNPTEIIPMLVSTLAMGAAARQQPAHAVVNRAYQQVRDHLERVYPDLELSIVEQGPALPARRAVLREELEKTQAADDAVLLALAAALGEALASHQPQAAQVVAVDLQEVRAKLARFRNLASSGDGLRVKESEFDELEVDSVAAGGQGGAVGPDTLQVTLDQSQINTLVVTLGKQTPAEVRALSVAYLHRLIEQLNLLPLGGVDKKAASSQEATMQLSAVYTALLTETNNDLWGPSGRARVGTSRR